MLVRRVVTGHRAGKAVFLSDGAPTAQAFVAKQTPGMESHFLWATPPTPQIRVNDDPETVRSDTKFLPPAGETRLLFLQVPPASVALSPDFDAAAAAEFMEEVPEIAATHEPGNPGMHRTETVDYIIVLEGEIHLELDDQQEVVLRPHDVVVQNATRHAWRNRTDRPVKLACVLVGARREA